MQDGDGDDDPAGWVLGVPLGLVAGGLDGAVDAPPVGVAGVPPPEVEPAGELLLVCVEGCVDGFLPLGVACWLVALGVAAVPGLAAPPTGPDVRGAPGALCDGTRLTAGLPVAGDPAGDWFAAGVLLNTPEASMAARPPLATTAIPAAIKPARRR